MDGGEGEAEAFGQSAPVEARSAPAARTRPAVIKFVPSVLMLGSETDVL